MQYSAFSINQAQLDLVEAPLEKKIFLEGPAGSGKTTAGVERLLRMMDQGVRGDSILVLVPQRTLAEPFYYALQNPGVIAGGSVTISTVGGLARRMVDIFWPMIAGQAGFGYPDQQPIFLTLETAQYYMSRVVSPLLQEGFFGAVTIDRNRIYGQIIDNLNKSAVVGFDYSEIGERLKAAWSGDPGQLRVYDDVQHCVTHFRKFCLQHNLLDFSLQVELFWKYLWKIDFCKDYLFKTYKHIIFDNIEEDIPIAHNLIIDLLPRLSSALLIYDLDAGYRRFLGADPVSALRTRELCDDKYIFRDSVVCSQEVKELNNQLKNAIHQPGLPIMPFPKVISEKKTNELIDTSMRGIDREQFDTSKTLHWEYHRYYPEMLDWVADQIEELVNEEGYSPSDIAVLAPYMSDALRFSIVNRLENRFIPVRSHRPSRSLREEPATQCLLTISTIAHPGWGFTPSKFDVAYALVQAIDGLDLIRAQLLTEIVYRVREGIGTFSPFEKINPRMQERISYRAGSRYEALRVWIEENTVTSSDHHEEPLDYFLSRLFGEVLSQPGFGFHGDFQRSEVAANLVESIQKFHRIAEVFLQQEDRSLGQEYYQMVMDGVIAAQYIRSWEPLQEDAVLLTPAYTFLMRNRPVDVQFWLDAGSRGWYQRVYQPLTHPYVLSRNWSEDQLWTDSDEVEVSQENLYRLVSGLLKRCRQRLYLGLSDLGEQGYEQRGVLLHVLQRVLRRGAP